MASELWGYLKGERAEDPKRLVDFREQMTSLNWSPAETLKSLEKLFCSVDALAMAELRYYYRRRTSRAYLSGFLRALAWVFGALGVLLPLLATTGERFKGGSEYGYACLALGMV